MRFWMVYSPNVALLEDVIRRANEALRGLGATGAAGGRFSVRDVKDAPRGRGDLALPVFRVARECGLDVEVLARRVAAAVGESPYVERVDVVGGYVNMWVDVREYGGLVLSTVFERGERYGFFPVERPVRVIVEHTSANPIHPLHLGHLRNCLLGDALARLLRARGHDVRTHYYIDDVGLQVAYAVYGYRKVRDFVKELGGLKKDHLIGLIYSMTYTLVEIEGLKRRIKEAEARGDLDGAAELRGRLDSLVAAAKRLRDRNAELFDRLLEAISRDADPEGEVRRLNLAYERGDLGAVRAVREAVDYCLEGFKETFRLLGVEFDSWDWESELTVWNGAAARVLEELVERGYAYMKEGAYVFAADRVAEDPEVRRRLRIPTGYEVPPATLTRADGTTLYPTRDIAYSLWKFKHADRVINVIAVQQSLAQVHVRLALYALGAVREAENLVHYAYEVVRLPGRKMSGRRGEYISVDDLLGEAVGRVREIIKDRELSEEEKEDVAVKVGVGAVKFAFLNLSPLKVLTFRWERALDFSQNSGPFVQYSYVRGRSVLRRAREAGLEPRLDCLHRLGGEEKPLVLMVGRFPDVVAKAGDELRPDLVASYLNFLAQEFNKYYDSVRIILEDEELACARLAVVKAVATVLRNGLGLLGIVPPEKM